MTIFLRGQIMIRTLLVTAAATAAFTSAGWAQDYGQDPTYGSVSLSSGFTPDPYTVDLQSGGSIDAESRLGGDCRGYVANAPDFSVNYTSGSFPLIFSVDSGSDTTLVINGPDTNWYCDDDSGEGLNPSVRFDNPASGRYDVWVGTYSSSELRDATLNVSELYSE